MRRTLRARWVLAAAALALPLAYLASPPSAPPLYDGLGAPDEPYRYVGTSPAGATTERPTSAEASVVLKEGRSTAAVVATAEKGPQASLVVAPAGLDVPPSAEQVLLRIEPVALPEPPEDGEALSNAYRLSATDDGGKPVPIAKGARQTIVQLRIPAKTDRPVALELHDDGKWVALETRRTGEDVYSAFLPKLGVVAAVQITESSRTQFADADADSGGLALLLALGGAAVLLAVFVLLLRRAQPSS